MLETDGPQRVMDKLPNVLTIDVVTAEMTSIPAWESRSFREVRQLTTSSGSKGPLSPVLRVKSTEAARLYDLRPGRRSRVRSPIV